MAMIVISSTKNPRVTALRELKTRRGREEKGLYLVEGVKMVHEALGRPGRVRALWLSETAGEDAAQLAAQAECTVYQVPEHVMQAISDQKTPQGILAELTLPTPPKRQALGPKLIALDDVQDPGNVGTILRTADAAGFTGAVLSKGCADPFSPKCLRATMGSVFRLPLYITDTLAQTLMELRGAGYDILAAELSTDDFFKREALAESFALVIGNEGNGISQAVSDTATHHLALPMAGGAESLNAAVAAGIMMYDLSFRETGLNR